MSTELKYGSKKFVCPHCDVLAKQDWFSGQNLSETVISLCQHHFLDYRGQIRNSQQETIQQFLYYMKDQFPQDIAYYLPHSLALSKCQACNQFTLWVDKEIVYPRQLNIESPNSDMEQEIQDLYYEAAKIFQDSPKGATAILRLALQKLLLQLGQDGKNINNDIKALVSQGLNPKMQKALDFVRVVGNNAVHPGVIDLDDNRDIALKLFKIINLIAEDMITKPKEMDELYDDIIPDETKEHISQRDGK